MTVQPTTPRERPTAVVVMGVAGCGKTTIAKLLAARLRWAQAEADDFHPADNVAKMAAGIPLTDADRQPWLESLRDWITEQDQNVVITCSALRRGYRDILRGATARVRFIHLHGSPEVLAARIGGRTDHFMPASLLESQLAILEPLEPDEDGVLIDVGSSPDEIVATAYDFVSPAADTERPRDDERGARPDVSR